MNANFLYWPWLISLLSVLTSLYFSNILMLPPCNLCWWQRIFMYPLSIILGIGFAKKDLKSLTYTAPFVVLGWITAFYHNLLYYKIIENSIIPCTADVSCTSKQIEWLGFITIPLLSLMAFSVLLVLIILYFLKVRKYE